MGNDRLANLGSDLLVFLALAFFVYISHRPIGLRDLAIYASFWASWDIIFIVVFGRYRNV